MIIPARLAAACRNRPERERWLSLLPHAVRELESRWALTLGSPFAGMTCSWVAPASLSNGTRAVLKIGMPHMEGEHEIAGLRFWNGDPTVRLLNADDALGAMLLERCEPGCSLATRDEADQDLVIAALLRRLWRKPSLPHPFRALSGMTAYWAEETLAQEPQWPDAALVREGLRLLQELPQSAPAEALLATDLHAGNVLRSQREEWLVIDPKPFIGDPAWDATQHLFNCEHRLRAKPDETIHRFADLLGVERERVRLYIIARSAAEPRDVWTNDWRLDLARKIAR